MLTAALTATGLERFIGWLEQPAVSHRADAIVVLGGDITLRVLHGSKLYRQGLGRELWITGDQPWQGKPAPWSVSAAEVAQRHGVPGDAIRLLASRSTWEDGKAVAAFADGRNVRSVLVVTSWYHNPRAVCVMKEQLAGHGIEVYHDAAAGRRYDQLTWWRYPSGWLKVSREIAALGFYWLRYGVSPWRCSLA